MAVVPPWLQASLLIALVVFIVTDALIRRKRAYLQRGPREWPLIGALPWVVRHRERLLQQALREFEALGWSATWSAWWLGGGPRHHFSARPDVVEHILKSRFDNYVKGAIFRDNLSDLLGAGIFTSDGEPWRGQRKLVSHMFSRREFQETISEALVRHCEELDGIVARAGAANAGGASGDGVNMQKLFFGFTLDTIGEVAFGDRIGALSDPAVPFSAAFDEAQAIVELRFVTPGWQLLERVNGSHGRLHAALRVMDDYCRQLVARRRAAGDCARRRDLLSRVMALGDDDAGAALVRAGGDAFLRDFVLNTMIAGRDTTGQACSWAVWEVARSARRTAIEDALAEEARRVLGPAPVAGGGPGRRGRVGDTGGSGAPAAALGVADGGIAEGSAAWHDRVSRDLRYAQAVVLETLRLHPSVPKNIKTALHDDVLPDGTVVRAGEYVSWMPYVMGRSPAVWGADAAEFKPERWLDGSPRPSPFVFPAFNAGPRTCPGQPLAMLEATVVLATVYRRASLTLAPASQAAALPHLESLTLPQRDGVRCAVRLRPPPA